MVSEEDGVCVLSSKIRAANVYQIQQDTLIQWTDTDGRDLALSFQEISGCQDIFDQITEIQKRVAVDNHGILFLTEKTSINYHFQKMTKYFKLKIISQRISSCLALKCEIFLKLMRLYLTRAKQSRGKNPSLKSCKKIIFFKNFCHCSKYAKTWKVLKISIILQTLYEIFFTLTIRIFLHTFWMMRFSPWLWVFWNVAFYRINYQMIKIIRMKDQTTENIRRKLQI